MGNVSKSSSEPTANERAALAQESIVDRNLARAFGLPLTRISRIAWPMPAYRQRKGMWHYWWQAHLTDLLIDAQLHRPSPDGALTVNRMLRGIRIRNLGRWTNNYYDDMAWLGLAAERAQRHFQLGREGAVRVLTDRMLGSWIPQRGGGIPWRTMDLFFNAPANGPAAILVARTGHTERAVAMCDWLDANLIDPTTHLVIDGIKPTAESGSDTSKFEHVTAIYSYCQGVVLGAEVEAYRLTGEARHVERIARLLDAVEHHHLRENIIPSSGGGDGGLFSGVFARYLALVATDLRGDHPDIPALRERAATIARANADAAWANRAVDASGRIFFGPDWAKPAQIPTASGGDAEFVEGAVHSSKIPERDLSVQLSGWMVLEAAAAVELGRAEVGG
ncbi:hypothetical protein GOEFS_110_00110 [Gordonia effusa NBRC 100432]|uniref:Fructose-bisphosphate aldolase n=1 Tax=Gordonia effusa NBRC 100432 TaxID=1077974 RepID=H0R5D2_9ACTN|nr:glycoside hydrolase family 76 protein [Gordonia effusa]GAB20283.1 hypothetical protein GOEFS_110_00110 [Gordonia effusa NBRC 100432]